MGIYIIECVINGKWYIGSSKNLKSRWDRHIKDLRKQIHHNAYLQRAYNKYGEVNFKFIIVEVVKSHSELFRKEEYYIDSLKPEYNIGGVCGGDNFTNNPRKEEIRKVLSQNLKRYLQSLTDEEYKEFFVKYGKNNPNYKHGLYVKGRVCICGGSIHSGSLRCQSCENGDRFGEKNTFYGKTHSEKTKALMSNLRKGKPHPKVRKSLMCKGVFYEKCEDAAKALGVTLGTITYRLNSSNYPSVFLSSCYDPDAPLEDPCDKANYLIEGLLFKDMKAVAEHFNITVSVGYSRVKSKADKWVSWNKTED